MKYSSAPSVLRQKLRDCLPCAERRVWWCVCVCVRVWLRTASQEAGMAAGCVGRVSVNATTRASQRMDHGDATHDIGDLAELLAILGIEEVEGGAEFS